MNFLQFRAVLLPVVLFSAGGLLAAEESTAKPSAEPLPPMSAKELKKLSGDLLPESMKPKIAVLDATVSLDGVLRPDLGIAISDTIAARLLREDDFEILDSSTSGPVGQMPLPGTEPARLAPPGPSVAVETGKALGADFVVVPTIIGQTGEFRVTMRKLRVEGGKVESILLETVRGNVKSLFTQLEYFAERLIPAKVTPPITYVKVWMSTPTLPLAKPAVPAAGDVSAAPKALPSAGHLTEKPGRAPRMESTAPEPVKVGRIDLIDHEWSFCEIASPPGVVLEARQQIFAWSGGDLSKLVPMTVSRVEGDRAIADLPRTSPHADSLRSGDFVYCWSTPAAPPSPVAR